MPDRAAQQTNRLLASLQRELNRLYNATDDEIQAAAESYLEAIYLDDEEAGPRKRLRHAQNNGLDSLVEIVTAYILLANERAVERINAIMNDVAGINYEHIRSSVEKKTSVDIGGTAEAYEGTRYSKRAYRRATQHKYVSDTVMKQVKTGIRAGENVKGIARHIQKAANVSRNSAIRTAITESTRIRNASRLDAMLEAKKRGIEMVKIWRHSPYVNDPRHWHQNMEGEQHPPNEPFSNGLMHPGEAGAPAEEVINCRCFLDEEVTRW